MWSTSELTGELYFMLMYVKISNCMPEVCTLCHMSHASTNVPERGQEHRTRFQEVLRQQCPVKVSCPFPTRVTFLQRDLLFISHPVLSCGMGTILDTFSRPLTHLVYLECRFTWRAVILWLRFCFRLILRL